MRTQVSTGVLLLACACAAPEFAPPTHLGQITGTWTWVGEPADGGRIPTLTIGKDGKLHGNGGVNKFQGRLHRPSLGRGEWSVETLSVTEMAGTQPAMAQEHALLTGIASATSVFLAGDALELRLGSEILATFRRTRI